MKKSEFIEQAKAVTNDEFDDFIGANSYRFISTRDKIINGQSYEWAWMPALFSIYWAAYYKFWSGFLYFLYTVFLTACTLCLPIIVDAVMTTAGEGDSSYLNTFTGVWYFLCMLIPFVMCGLKMKILYVRHVHRKIVELKNHESSPEKLKTLLRRCGGTSIAYLLITVLVVVILASIPVLYSAETESDAGSFSTSNQADIAEEKISEDAGSGPIQFTLQERSKMMDRIGTFEMLVTNIDSCLSNRIFHPFVNLEELETAKDKLYALNLGDHYAQCYSLSEQEIGDLFGSIGKRPENIENRRLVSMVSEMAASDDDLLEQVVTQCNQLATSTENAIQEKMLLTDACK